MGRGFGYRAAAGQKDVGVQHHTRLQVLPLVDLGAKHPLHAAGRILTLTGMVSGDCIRIACIRSAMVFLLKSRMFCRQRLPAPGYSSVIAKIRIRVKVDLHFHPKNEIRPRIRPDPSKSVP